MNKILKSRLNEMASEIVGDGVSPNMFFVSHKGEVITITKNFNIAYKEWLSLPGHQESALEDRLFGTIASSEPDEDGSTTLATFDDSRMFLEMYPSRLS